MSDNPSHTFIIQLYEHLLPSQYVDELQTEILKLLDKMNYAAILSDYSGRIFVTPRFTEKAKKKG